MNLGPPLKPLLGPQLGEMVLPPLDWILAPVFTRGDKVVIAGESSAGKSWMLISLALHVAAGKDWLGFGVKPQRVLYVDEEMNERTAVRRIKRLAAGAGIDLKALGDQFGFLPHPGLRMHDEGAKRLLQRLGDFKPELVMSEALVRILVGTENDAEAVGQFWRNVRPLTAKGITFIVSHHLRKRSQNPDFQVRRLAEEMRGSGDILAGADVQISHTKDPDRKPLEYNWFLGKARESEERSLLDCRMTDRCSGTSAQWDCKPGAHNCPTDLTVFHPTKVARVRSSSGPARPSGSVDYSGLGRRSLFAAPAPQTPDSDSGD